MKIGKPPAASSARDKSHNDRAVLTLHMPGGMHNYQSIHRVL
jgi:hypothetical protein